MLKEEFERLTCQKWKDEDFDAINIAYEELDNMTKQEFCSTLLRNSWRLVSELGKLVRESRVKSEEYKHALQEVGTFVFADDTASAKYVLTNKLGLRECVKIKLENDIALNDNEKLFVFSLI